MSEDDRATTTGMSRDLANEILGAIGKVGGEVGELRGDMRREFGTVHERLDGHDEAISQLQRAVHGSEPPAGGMRRKGPSLPDVAEMASDAGADVTELRAEMREGFASVRSELDKQSNALGVGALRGLKWLASKDGRTTIMRLVTLGAAIYAALHAAAGH